MYGMTFVANTYFHAYTGMWSRQNIWLCKYWLVLSHTSTININAAHHYCLGAHDCTPYKFWWGQMHLEDAWICQLNLLSSCSASQSSQQKCVWFGVNLSFHFDTSFSLHFPFFNWRRQDLQQTNTNSLVHQDCRSYMIIFVWLQLISQ